MVYPISTREIKTRHALNSGKIVMILSGIVLAIAGLTIFQDFLASKRSGYAFYFDESLLFKTGWFVFVPILTVLHGILSKGRLHGGGKIAALIISPIVAHLAIAPFVATVLSSLFYEGRYDLFKFFSYTMAHDFHLLAIGYAGFVLGYRFFHNRTIAAATTENKRSSGTIVINNGKDNVIVNVSDIIQITSATPYVSIRVEHKEYLYSETLKSMCERLDADIFVRIHKSTVVNISKVVSFKSRLNGDYDLRLKNGDSVRLSRTYAADFKKHFNTGHQVGL